MIMNESHPLDFGPVDVLQCPACGKDLASDGQVASVCAACHAHYFSLGGVPCLFPAGIHHKDIWQHQTGLMQQRGEDGLAQLHETLARYDLTPTTRDRLVESVAALEMSQSVTLALLASAGIEPKVQASMGNMNPGDLAEYYDLILRDWAWPGGENSAALERVLARLPQTQKPKRILVLGAGAGRLSWDLHCALKPEFTVALDSNPLLLIVADRLIRQRESIELAEFKLFPQIGCDVTQTWTLQPPDDPDHLRERWFALGANAWWAPLRSASFDLVITPWFIDVNGGDVRDTIALVSRLLAPEGTWINSGPLLFTRHLPLDLKYQAREIREFLAMSGFVLESEEVVEADHLDSPLEVRKQHEQLWTFAARAPEVGWTPSAISGDTPAWLVMHHLTIPKRPLVTQEEHPLIDAIVAMVDGTHSINDITAHIAPHIPKEISPKDAVVTVLGEIVAKMNGTLS
jgi:N2227-like protein